VEPRERAVAGYRTSTFATANGVPCMQVVIIPAWNFPVTSTDEPKGVVAVSSPIRFASTVPLPSVSTTHPDSTPAAILPVSVVATPSGARVVGGALPGLLGDPAVPPPAACGATGAGPAADVTTSAPVDPGGADGTDPNTAAPVDPGGADDPCRDDPCPDGGGDAADEPALDTTDDGDTAADGVSAAGWDDPQAASTATTAARETVQISARHRRTRWH